MVKNFKALLLVIAAVFFVQNTYSQLGLSHEIGVIVGPVAFQSDFGVRRDFETNAGNTGIGIGIVHYLNFAYRADCNCYSTDTYFNDHFKLRSEISWNKTNLNHFGKWVEDSRTSIEADQLRAHSGVAENWNVGMQLEYFPKSIRAFTAGAYSFAPFISLGAQYTWYSPQAATTFGDGNIRNASNFYSFWEPGSVNPENGSTWSLVGSVGTRYKLTLLSDLMIDLRWQYYFTDWVDGLDHQLDSNKANDYLVWLNIGYIYYLD